MLNLLNCCRRWWFCGCGPGTTVATEWWRWSFVTLVLVMDYYWYSPNTQEKNITGIHWWSLSVPVNGFFHRARDGCWNPTDFKCTSHCSWTMHHWSTTGRRHSPRASWNGWQENTSGFHEGSKWGSLHKHEQIIYIYINPLLHGFWPPTNIYTCTSRLVWVIFGYVNLNTLH